MFENFPYSNFHDLNTDWIVKKIKDVETSEANAKASEKNAKASELNASISDASAQTWALQANNSAKRASEQAQASAQSAAEADNYVTSTRDQVNLLQSRVDNIIPSGTQTEGNTELLDIRVAEDGQIYDSAGNAVRGQVRNLKNVLNGEQEIAENLLYSKVSAINEYTVNVTGSIPTIANISRYDGGLTVDTGTYMFCAKIAAGNQNTATSGNISIQARVYNTTTGAGTTSPSSIALAPIFAGQNDRIVFTLDIEEAGNIWIYIFGTSATTGTVLDLTLSNMAFVKVDENFTIEELSTYFLNDFSEEYTKYSDGLIEDVNSLSQEVNSLSQEVNSLSQEVNSLSQEVNSLSQESDLLDQRVTALEADSGKTVVCWGDSLTNGAGGNGTTYPSVLSSLIGNDFTIYSYGVGGENAQTIAGRCGAIPYILLPCTIPQDSQPHAITIKALNGEDVQPVLQRRNEFRQIFIDDVEFYLAYDSTNFTYTLQSRYNLGGTTTISTPRKIIPYESTNADLKGAIQCLCIGTNGWGSDDVLDLTSIMQTIINYEDSSRYIVIGMPTHYSTSNINEQKNSDRVLGNVFGNHYVNLYAYLASVYALNDAGITPTPQDNTDLADGKVPTSLRSDGTHLNSYGYTLMAQQVYKCGKELGYWN